MSRSLRFRLIMVPGLLSASLLATACGSSSSGNGEAKKTGPEVAKDAAAALGASGAVHIAGQGVDSSTKKQLTIDAQLQADGTSGTFTLGGTPVNVIEIGNLTYVKTTAAFYESQGAAAAVATKVANRWVKVTGSSDFESFTLSGISKSLTEPSNGAKINSKVDTGKLGSQKVVIVSENDGSQLFVAATGKPLPLKIVSSAKSSDGAGALTFTDYGKRQSIKAPAGALDATS
jgi:hypothetical protein